MASHPFQIPSIGLQEVPLTQADGGHDVGEHGCGPDRGDAVHHSNPLLDGDQQHGQGASSLSHVGGAISNAAHGILGAGHDNEAGIHAAETAAHPTGENFRSLLRGPTPTGDDDNPSPLSPSSPTPTGGRSSAHHQRGLSAGNEQTEMPHRNDATSASGAGAEVGPRHSSHLVTHKEMLKSSVNALRSSWNASQVQLGVDNSINNQWRSTACISLCRQPMGMAWVWI